MGFNLAGLTAYVEERQDPLVKASLFGAKMMQNATVLDNIKGNTALPRLSQTVYFQTDACGFNATGDTTITQRLLVPGKVRINQQWCPKDFEPYFLRAGIPAGAMREKVDPEAIFQAITSYIVDIVNQEVDKAVWQARITASGGGVGSTVPMGTGNNAYWDGLRFQIQDSIGGGTYIDANSTSIYDSSAIAAFNVSTMQEACMRIYMALANNGLDQGDDTIVYMGYDKFTALVASLIAGGATYGAILNGGFQGSPDPRMGGLTFPGTNLKVLPVAGLNSINAIYGTKKSNVFIGVDGASDTTAFDVWYSKDDRVVKFAQEFKISTQIALPGEVAAIVL